MDWVHIVIVGCGRVGSGLGVGLSEQGHSVSIIDRSPKAFRRLPADWSGTTVIGSGFDRGDLDRAGAREAAALAAVTSGDNSNILTARIARETYEIPNVVARIYDPRRAQIYLRLGIPTVATVSWTIDQVRRRLVPGEVESEWTDSTGTLSLVERELPERWAGKRLADVSVPGDMTVVAVTRAGVARLDFTELVGQDGDVLHVMVSDKALDRLNVRLARSAEERAGHGGSGPIGAEVEPVPDRAELAGAENGALPEPGAPDAGHPTGGGAVTGGRP